METTAVETERRKRRRRKRSKKKEQKQKTKMKIKMKVVTAGLCWVASLLLQLCTAPTVCKQLHQENSSWNQYLSCKQYMKYVSAKQGTRATRKDSTVSYQLSMDFFVKLIQAPRIGLIFGSLRDWVKLKPIWIEQYTLHLSLMICKSKTLKSFIQDNFLPLAIYQNDNSCSVEIVRLFCRKLFIYNVKSKELGAEEEGLLDSSSLPCFSKFTHLLYW